MKARHSDHTHAAHIRKHCLWNFLIIIRLFCFFFLLGMTMEDLKKRRTQKPEFRKAQRDAALREAKERKKKVIFFDFFDFVFDTFGQERPSERKENATVCAASGIERDMREMSGGMKNVFVFINLFLFLLLFLFLTRELIRLPWFSYLLYACHLCLNSGCFVWETVLIVTYRIIVGCFFLFVFCVFAAQGRCQESQARQSSKACHQQICYQSVG